MKEKTKNIILITAFYSILILPMLIYPLVKNRMDNINYENRNLMTMNDLLESDLDAFPKNFDNFFSDKLPFKNELRKIRSSIKYSVFNTPTDEKVIIGKDGWLFYNSGVDGISNEVADYEKTELFSEEIKQKIYENLDKINKKMEKNGMDFYLFIPSNKSSIYGEYMPSVFKEDTSTNKNRTDLLVDYLIEKGNINVIYPKDKLIEYKSVGQTYFKYDTHWNDFGGFIGAMEIAKEIDDFRYNIKDYDLDYYHNKVGDLSAMNLSNKYADNYEPVVKGYYDDVIPQCTSSDDVIECYNDSAPYDKSIMLVGDSFRTAMINHLSRTYKHVIIVYVIWFKYDYHVTKYNPDTFIYEVVERNVGHQLLDIYKSFE